MYLIKVIKINWAIFIANFNKLEDRKIDYLHISYKKILYFSILKFRQIIKFISKLESKIIATYKLIIAINNFYYNL